MNYEEYLVAIAIAKCKCASSQVPCFWATKKKFKGSTTTKWFNATNWTIDCYWNGLKEFHIKSIGYNSKATTTYSFHIKLNDVYEKLQTWLVIKINTNSKVVTFDGQPMFYWHPKYIFSSMCWFSFETSSPIIAFDIG